MTTTVTDPDTALDGLRCQVDQLLAMDPAEWTLDQLQRTILDVHTPHPAAGRGTGQNPGVFRYPRRRSAVGRALHHGDWLATSTRTPAGHASWWVPPPAPCVMCCQTATALADRGHHHRPCPGDPRRAPHHR